MELDRWKGRLVRLKRTVQARVMISKELVVEVDDWGNKTPRKVSLVAGEVFTVINHYDGRLDLLYQPRKMPEKVVLHMPISFLEEVVNGHQVI